MSLYKYFVGVIATICISCSIKTEPVSGPNGSWWLGGADGGVFVKIEKDTTSGDRIYRGVIYFESGEKIWYEGEMQLVGKTDFDPDNREQYLFWDGELLHLVESSYLKPLDPIPPL